MAHTCPECGYDCHCCGDIDDINFGESYDCNCAWSTWGCGKELGSDEDDEDEQDWWEQNVPKTQ